MLNPEGAADALDTHPRALPTWFFGVSCAALTAAYLALALVSITELPLLDPDEPRYAGAGRTMAQGGSLLVPEFNGEPRINKPPLFYWLVALSDKLAGGATETSSRLPSVAMGLVMLWGTIWLGRKVFGAATGLLAGVVLASTPLFIALSRCCITDMTLSFSMAGTLAWLMLGMNSLAPPKKAKWIATILFGLAVLTKATAALAVLIVVVLERAFALPKGQRPAASRWIPWLLLAAIIFSSAAVQCAAKGKVVNESRHAKVGAPVDDSNADTDAASKNIWTTLDSILNKCALAIVCGVVVLLILMAYRAERLSPALPAGWKWGLLIAISMGLWWYGMLIGVQGWPRFYALLDFELRQRVNGAVHREGMYYYIGMLPLVTLPWSFGFPWALGSAWPASNNLDSSPKEIGNQRADTFLVAWMIGIVLFFSIPGAKLPTYIMPAMPAVALLIARFLVRRNAALAGGIVGAGAMALIFFAAPTIVERMKSRSTKQLSGRIDDAIKDCSSVKTLGVAAESLSYYLNRPVQALHWKPLPAGKTGTERLNDFLGRDESAAIIIEKRFVPRMLGKGVELGAVSAEKLNESIPKDLSFVYSDDAVLVLRNRVGVK
jgi:4-amino-4-deoxy-L-arabinose transferase-like glycosyltransferase